MGWIVCERSWAVTSHCDVTHSRGDIWRSDRYMTLGGACCGDGDMSPRSMSMVRRNTF